jgi:flavin-dependent dehydrogenase
VLTYDAIVVGARPGGAATAMLLARQGLRVLLVDRGRYGTDTLSTHALMRGSVYLLSQWGLLDRLVKAETPPVRRTRFDYGVDGATIDIKPSPGVPALYGPRRTVLDAMLVDAATEAGADIRFGVTITGLERDSSGRVVGVTGHDRLGEPIAARAGLTVGADGVRSTVASAVGAGPVHRGMDTGVVIYGYWAGLEVEGYEWFYRPGHTAGFIPTNDGEVCVFAGAPKQSVRGRPTGDYLRLLKAATDGAGGRLAGAVRPRRLHTWIGHASYIRQAQGPGWALVGDAASFLDPLSTHGITDALRDAHLLARAVGLDSLASYAEVRDATVRRMSTVVGRIASYSWDMDEIRRLLLDLSAAMNAEFTDTITDPARSPAAP